MIFFTGLFCRLLLFLFLAVAAQSAQADRKIHFNIPPQRADLSLTAFAKQARLTLIFPFDLVKTKTTNNLVGEFQIEEAIRILLRGTGLQADVGDDNQLKISVGQPLGGRQNMNDKAGKSAGILALFTSLFAAAPAIADDTTNTPNVLEEIVVTAQKREQNLQDVGISITAFGRDQLQQLNLNNSNELVYLTPGLALGNPVVKATSLPCPCAASARGTSQITRNLPSRSTRMKFMTRTWAQQTTPCSTRNAYRNPARTSRHPVRS